MGKPNSEAMPASESVSVTGIYGEGLATPKPNDVPFIVSEIGMASNDTIYTNRDGSKSLLTVMTRVSHPDGIHVDVPLYARLSVNGELTFSAAVPSGGRKGVSFDSVVKDIISDRVELAIAAWPKWSDAADRAERVLTRPTRVSGMARPSALGGPRLIKPLAVATSSSATAIQ